jgi:hypothetical protein
MPRPRLAEVGPELFGRRLSLEIARAQLFDLDVDRKRRIDDIIDYFGVRACIVDRDPCGESLLDEAVAW